MLGHNRDACNDVASLLSEERVRLEAGRVVAAGIAENEVSRFLRGLVFLIKDCVEEYITFARAFISKRSLTVLKILRSVEDDIFDIVSDLSVLYDTLLKVICVILCRDVLLLHWIDAAPNVNSSAVPAPDKTRSSSSSH